MNASSILEIVPPATEVAGTTSFPCKACGNAADNRVLLVPGDPLTYPPEEHVNFPYAQCTVCGSLSLIAVPEDIGRYYQGDYYSHLDGKGKGWRARLQALRDHGHVFGAPWPVRVLADAKPHYGLSHLRRLTRGEVGKPLTRESAILDVGCGSGAWLYRLAKLGFSSLTGADPFLREEVPGKPVRLLRADINAVQGRYALINCSHALEHVPDPTSDLRAMGDRLEDGGVILLRLPVLNRFAWETYGGNWVQLDAPRHLVLFTVEGVRRLAAATGLVIADTAFDATELMDLGSRVRQRNVFPHGPAELWQAETAALGPEAAKVAKLRAKQENASGTSDQASFFLTRS